MKYILIFLISLFFISCKTQSKIIIQKDTIILTQKDSIFEKNFYDSAKFVTNYINVLSYKFKDSIRLKVKLIKKYDTIKFVDTITYYKYRFKDTLIINKSILNKNKNKSENFLLKYSAIIFLVLLLVISIFKK